jgi:hypothetical protein
LFLLSVCVEVLWIGVDLFLPLRFDVEVLWIDIAIAFGHLRKRGEFTCFDVWTISKNHFVCSPSPSSSLTSIPNRFPWLYDIAHFGYEICHLLIDRTHLIRSVWSPTQWVVFQENHYIGRNKS